MPHDCDIMLAAAGEEKKTKKQKQQQQQKQTNYETAFHLGLPAPASHTAMESGWSLQTAHRRYLTNKTMKC